MTMLSNRLSYFLDVHGPSLSVDTACSSSLVAFHLACQAVWNDECEMALVGAVNVMFRPEYMVAMCKGQFLAPDGRSKSFDQRANGYGRGEGAGVIVVKPLDRAPGRSRPHLRAGARHRLQPGRPDQWHHGPECRRAKEPDPLGARTVGGPGRAGSATSRRTGPAHQLAIQSKRARSARRWAGTAKTASR